MTGDHDNCEPGCTLHPELHYSGWVATWTTGRYHYFTPGMNISECGHATIQDDAVRLRKPPSGMAICRRCDVSIATTSRKIREAGVDQ